MGLSRLAESLPARSVRTVGSGRLHITLRFLGELSLSEVDRASSAAEHVAAATRPFSVTPRGLGAFPNDRAPRIIWVGVDAGRDSLATVHGRLNQGLAIQGFGRTEGLFSPHITLGRVRRGAKPDDLAAIRRLLSTAPAGRMMSFRASAIIVMRSLPDRAGSIYTPLYVAHLKG